MRRFHRGRTLAMATLCGLVVGCVTTQMRANPKTERPAPEEKEAVAFPLSAKPPKGALPLFAGKAEEVGANWYRRYSVEPAAWTVDAEGVMSPKNGDISSKQEFGDCYLHVEYRIPTDANGNAIGHGNSGVGLQGRYEVQILNSFDGKLEPGGNGALYSQIPAQVNASKKPGEWQSFDIIFRAPRFENNGQVAQKPRATVFHNGVIIHNNAEFLGMTGIQYDQYKEMSKTGPIVLQGDHDPVQYRNIWIVPM